MQKGISGKIRFYYARPDTGEAVLVTMSYTVEGEDYPETEWAPAEYASMQIFFEDAPDGVPELFTPAELDQIFDKCWENYYATS